MNERIHLCCFCAIPNPNAESTANIVKYGITVLKIL